MKTITSVSGGRTSAFVAANYPSDYLLFALVRTDDERCKYPDEKLRLLVQDRIQAPFIGTLEDDMIIHTMFDLEQYLGREIKWVTGITYDEVLTKGGWLPNKLHRYCTYWMKIMPMFEWWRQNITEPVQMQIGYRANEVKRANTMNGKLNENGLLEMEAVVGKRGTRNKWGMVEWQKPIFPLIENNIYKDTITKYWEDKPVRFADYNNCEGCFHRSPLFLAKRFQVAPNKLQWFADQEKGREKGTWREDVRYEDLKNWKSQNSLSFDDFSGCDTGFCEM